MQVLSLEEAAGEENATPTHFSTLGHPNCVDHCHVETSFLEFFRCRELENRLAQFVQESVWMSLRGEENPCSRGNHEVFLLASDLGSHMVL